MINLINRSSRIVIKIISANNEKSTMIKKAIKSVVVKLVLENKINCYFPPSNIQLSNL